VNFLAYSCAAARASHPLPSSPFVDEDARTKEVEKERKATSLIPGPTSDQNEGSGIVNQLRLFLYFTVTLTGAEGMPLATTTRLLAPVSAFFGTSKCVETVFVPVATAMVLGLCVRA
jgi:hypothetical protein